MREPISPTARRLPLRSPRPGRAFTLIEMMVAISITAIMLLLVSRIFNETTQAIGLGADTSQIVANSRTLSDQLFQDISRMNVAKVDNDKISSQSRRREPGGFLVIIQQRNGGVRFPDPDNPNADPSNWPAQLDYNKDGDFADAGEQLIIRSDQLAFFTPADRAESTTPGQLDRYDSEAAATYQRVWYGHVARANLDGSAPANTEPGQPSAGNDDFDLRTATNLVLGRQGLLLLDDRSLLPDGGRVWGRPSPAAPEQLFPDSNPSDLVMAGATVGSFNLNSRVDAWQINNVTNNDYRQMRQGASDAMLIHDGENTGQSFERFFELGQSASDPDGLYATGSGLGFNRSGGYGPDALDPQQLPTDEYIRHALGWAYATPGGRLLTTQDIAYPFSPLAVGRNHTFFIPYVSDFAVDFAADITDDYAFADDPSTFDDLNGDGSQQNNEPPILENILLPWWDERFEPGYPGGQWRSLDPSRTDNAATIDVDERYVNGFQPDGLPDGRPDEYCIDPNGARIVGVKWYNMGDLANPVVCDPASPITGFPADRTRAATWWLPSRTPAPGGFNFGPFTNINQFNGQYHSETVVPGRGIGTVGNHEYPPFVGYSINPGGNPNPPTVGAVTFENNPGLPAQVLNRAVFVFGHTADYDLSAGLPPGDGTDFDGFESGSAKWWPYLLRIRYRLHDGDGSYYAEDELPTAAPVPADPDEDIFGPINGKWFEQIVPIRHYDNHLPELP